MADLSVFVARVRELFDYNPNTGVFIRKIRTAQCHRVGDRADFLATGERQNLAGYRRVGFDNQRFLAHRLAWLIAYGEWPALEIDHIDGNRSNNAISNLRCVSAEINAQNRRRARKDNKTGLLGAIPHADGRWRARISVNGRGVHIGLYTTPQLAHEAYVEAKRRLHAGCTI